MFNISSVIMLQFTRKSKSIGKCLFISLALMILAACSSNQVLPEAPKVNVVSAAPSELGLDSQVFIFNLEATNPNKFDLPLKGVEFTLHLSDIKVGEGKSNQSVNLVSGVATAFPVEVTTDLASTAVDLKSLFSSGGLNLDYSLEGKMLILGQAGIPFSLQGNLLK